MKNNKLTDSKHVTYEIIANVAPFLLFSEIFKGLLNIRERFFDFGNIPDELVRLEIDNSSTLTSKIFVTFYPSDCLMDFISALFANKGYRLFIKNSHNIPPF